MARLTISYGIAQIIVPALAGYIATRTGSYHGALWLAAAMLVLGMLALLAVQRRERAVAPIG